MQISMSALGICYLKCSCWWGFSGFVWVFFFSRFSFQTRIHKCLKREDVQWQESSSQRFKRYFQVACKYGISSWSKGHVCSAPVTKVETAIRKKLLNRTF